MGSEKALLISINRTEAWWLALKKNLPFETKILSDIQNKGDFPLSLNFNNIKELIYVIAVLLKLLL